MLVARDFREKAREALSGKWILAVCTGLIAAVLGAYTALESSADVLNSETVNKLSASAYYGGTIPDEVLVIVWSIASFYAMVVSVLALAHFILSGPISLGYAKFNLNLVDKKYPQFSDLFSQFEFWGKGFAMHFLRLLFVFLWTLLLFIPGLVAIYRYAMAPYILCENPYMSGYEAIQESKRLMDGNKWRLFCLSFSFLGWDILCIFTLGIGYLWLKPYREAAFAAFYREIKEGRYSSSR